MTEKLQSQEIFNLNPLAQITFDALLSACANHRNLGEKGKAKDVVNQFGEEALRADLAAEQTVLQSLRRYCDETGIRIEVRGEETGTSILGEKGERYVAVLDGLDGSSNYLATKSWPYGTMFAIAKGSNPSYKDFEVASISLPEENWILLAVKNVGVYLYDVDSKKFTDIKPFVDDKYDETKILSDNYFPEAKEMLNDMQNIWPRTGSTAASITSIVVGEQVKDSKFPLMNDGWQGLADVTRKGNLEQPILYLILTELGGVMLDRKGEDIGNNSFKEWGQSEKIPVISAKSLEIARKILSRLQLKG
jgi:fructose-1,6-bisphosphatase/inositol monophosphatase family enzyme